MDEIFRLEYHPIDGRPRRIRFLVKRGHNEIERVTEHQTRGEWVEIDTDIIDYFEYSDE
jgi:hypothetical protein